MVAVVPILIDESSVVCLLAHHLLEAHIAILRRLGEYMLALLGPDRGVAVAVYSHGGSHLLKNYVSGARHLFCIIIDV
jgi:hypothetical protein